MVIILRYFIFTLLFFFPIFMLIGFVKENNDTNIFSIIGFTCFVISMTFLMLMYIYELFCKKEELPI